MRFARLDLLRYGGFADRHYDFSAAETDLQVLHGANEAGKSTTLQAIGDLLFGFPHHKAQDWRFDAAQLRVGALVEQEGASFGMIRKRGTRQTLLDTDGVTPLDENRLIGWLGGTDRSAFERMWSLNHERLRLGGNAMAQFEDDLGQQLLAAGFGLENVQAVLDELEAEAGAIWKKNGRGTRLNELKTRMAEARAKLLAAEKDSQRWNSLSREAEDIEADLLALQTMSRDSATESASLERLKRVRGDLERHAQIMAMLDNAAPPRFTAQDHQHFDAMLARLVACQQKIDQQAGLHEGLAAMRAACHPDHDLLVQEAAIDALETRAAALAPLRPTWPAQQATLDALDLELRMAGQQGRYSVILAALPAPAILTQLRPLTLQYDNLTRREQENRAAQASAAERLATAESRLDATQAPALAPLLVALQQAGKRDTLDQDLASLERERQQAQTRLARSLKDLHPWQGDIGQLEAMAAPDPTLIEREMTLWRDRETQHFALQDALENLDQSRARQVLAKAHLDQRQIVSQAALLEARAQRDALFSTLATGNDDDRSAYLDATSHADTLADRRFDAAEDSARLTQIEQEIDRLALEQAHLRQRMVMLNDTRQTARAQWHDALTRRALPQLDPEPLRGWLALRAQALDASGALALIDGRARELVAQRNMAFDVLRQVLPDMPIMQSVSDALIWAQARREAWQKDADLATTLRADIDQEQRSLASEARKAEALAAERDALTRQWAREATDYPDLAPVPTETIDRLLAAHRAATEACTIEARLHAQRRDAERLDSDIVAFINQMPRQDGLALHPAQHALEKLVSALRQARMDRDKARNFDADLAKSTAELNGARHDLDRIRAEFASFTVRLTDYGADIARDTIGIDTIDSLRQVFAQEKDQMTLRDEARSIERRIASEDSTTDLAQLAQQAAQWPVEAVDQRLAEIALSRDTIERDRDEKLRRRGEIGIDLRQIEQAHDSRDAALSIEACRTAMTDAAEAWATARIQTLILTHVARQQRDANTNPLLQSAEHYFAALTCGRYHRLIIAEDGKSPELAALTAEDTMIRPGAMSEGTRDQLFLSLRLAALDQSRARGVSLPFIADDLFMTFDESRAEAGFATLAGLARHSQILFLTHHAHLADMARRFGGRTHTV